MLNLNCEKPLGQILLEAGLVSTFQLEVALRRQKYCSLKIGQILAYYGWIKQQTADFFAEKWFIILQKPKQRPVLFYLFLAGLISQEELRILKYKQKQIKSKTQLHILAIEEGYVKEETVNFFLKYIFNFHDFQQELSFTNVYKLLEDYSNGEMIFQGLELSWMSLNSLDLKHIILDSSMLKQAELKRTDLSYSSLIKVNLTLADLELANLSHVDFKQACLIEANLQNSNLQQASFQKANLQEADLRKANLYYTSFVAADLRGAKLLPGKFYGVYYSQETIFDNSFDPIEAGWKLKD